MASASDDFNRANSTGLGANWTATDTSLNVSSNTAVVVADPSGNFYNAITPGNNQFSEVTVTTLTGSGQSVGATVRMAAGPNYYGYVAVFNTNCELFKNVGGVFTTIDNTGGVPHANDVLRISVNGTSLTCTRNSATDITGSDSSLSSGKPGIQGFGAGAVDNWSGGDLASSVTPPLLLVPTTVRLVR